MPAGVQGVDSIPMIVTMTKECAVRPVVPVTTLVSKVRFHSENWPPLFDRSLKAYGIILSPTGISSMPSYNSLTSSFNGIECSVFSLLSKLFL